MASHDKPRLFVGSSVKGIPLAEAIQENLERNCRVIPWTQGEFELTKTVLESLTAELGQADFGLFIFTPDDKLFIKGEEKTAVRDNVLFELGMCIGALGRERSFVLMPRGLEDSFRMPTDLWGITPAQFDPDEGNLRLATGPACTKIKRHIERHGRRDSAAPSTRRVQGVLSRGSTEAISSLADGAISVLEQRHQYKEEIRRRLLGGAPLPTKYLYWSVESSLCWLTICKRESYTFYRESLRILREKAPEIAAKAQEAIGSHELDLVSLGSGDGEKDNILLRELARALVGSEKLYYYPIDVSDSLLVAAIHNSVGGGLQKEKIAVKAVVADFLRLPELQKIYEYRPSRNLFSILGNTIGNSDEYEIIEAISDSMLDGDCLLIEINVGSTQDFEDFVREPEAMQHDFSPLSTLGVPFDSSLITYSTAKNLSIVPETQSIVTKYKRAKIDGSEVDNITLSVVHHYNFEQFRRAVEQRIRVRTLYTYAESPVGLLLVQR